MATRRIMSKEYSLRALIKQICASNLTVSGNTSQKAEALSLKGPASTACCGGCHAWLEVADSSAFCLGFKAYRLGPGLPVGNFSLFVVLGSL